MLVRSMGLVALCGFLFLPDGSVSAQSWKEPGFIHPTLGEEYSISLAEYGSPDKTLVIRTLEAQERYRRFSGVNDSLSLEIRDNQTETEIHVGGFKLYVTIEEIYADDFDRDGNIDVYVKATGPGNGVLAAEGGIFEISQTDADVWEVDEVIFSETIPALFDIEGDGVWVFLSRKECWVLSSAHSTTERYWAQYYKPDTLNGGYYLANTELSAHIESQMSSAAEEYSQALETFNRSPSPRAAENCAYGAQAVVAQLIAMQDSSRLIQWLDEFKPTFAMLMAEINKSRTNLLYDTYPEFRAAVLEDFEMYSDPAVPHRCK